MPSLEQRAPRAVDPVPTAPAVPATPSTEYRTVTATPGTEYRTVTATPGTEYRTVTATPSTEYRTVTATPGTEYRTVTATPGMEYRTVTATPGTEYRTIRVVQADAAAAAAPGARGRLEGRVTRARRSEPPPTPLGAHRQLAVPAGLVPASPSIDCRASPRVQYRTVTVSAATAAPAHQVAACASPVVRMRTANALPGPSASPTVVCASVPASPLPQQIDQSLASSTSIAGAAPDQVGGFVAWVRDPKVQDPQVQRTISMLPPTPSNTLTSFLDGLVSGEVEPALCSFPPCIDGGRYWEKKRVQTSLRRLLEFLKDNFNADGTLAVQDLASAVFAELLRLSPSASGTLDEGAFINGIQALNSWPPELNSSDMSEVFAAFLAPTVGSLLGLRFHPLPREVGLKQFCHGLAFLPYNLPDFPVPKYLFSDAAARPATAREVADEIAAQFYFVETGLHRVRDLFLTGLISLEEIQAVLPRLHPDSVVEQAVTMIIKRGSRSFTEQDWRLLVFTPRTVPMWRSEHAVPLEPVVEPPAAEPLPAPDSPEQRYRQAAVTVAPTWASAAAPELGAAAAPASPPREAAVAGVLQQLACPRIMNWASFLGGDRDGGALGHQADEGAGMRPAGQEQAAAAGAAADDDNQAVRMISLDMHNECLGPFLAYAFAKCCEKYEPQD